LLDDAKAWIEFSAYPPDEIAVRFHHRLVQINAFPNGNGRHSRLMADLLAMRLGRDRFSWGRESLRSAGAVRQSYSAALRAADNHDFDPLLRLRALRHGRRRGVPAGCEDSPAAACRARHRHFRRECRRAGVAVADFGVSDLPRESGQAVSSAYRYQINGRKRVHRSQSFCDRDSQDRFVVDSLP
jgi:hypothetical protein